MACLARLRCPEIGLLVLRALNLLWLAAMRNLAAPSAKGAEVIWESGPWKQELADLVEGAERQ
jgi:hypothetical protein